MGRDRHVRRGGSNAAGFSLVELLIVVAVILVIAALAIPNMLHSKMAANEAAAVAALRTLAGGEVNYVTTYSSGFSPTLTALGPPASGVTASSSNADMVDSVLAGGIRGGYQFTYVPLYGGGSVVATGYQVNANPSGPGVTGEWFYFLDQSNVIRGSYSSPANASSTPIPN
jgi:prepilin-type N-terminal cleavage/methylation domain-containing protein